MNLKEFLESLSTGGWLGIIIVLMTVIQISPIKVDPWNALVNWIGSVINKDIITKINNMQSKIDNLEKGITGINSTLESHISKDSDDKMDSYRSKILDFAGEIANGKRHTVEQYNWILKKITEYTEYCKRHEHFVNSQCKQSIKAIEDEYVMHIKNKDFPNEK